MSSLLPKRVVITGLGAVTPLGATVSTTFQNLLEKKNGIRKLTATDMEFIDQLKVQSGGPLDGLDIELWKKKAGLIKSVYHALGVCSSWSALEDAKWRPENEEQYIRTGIMFGCGRTSSPDISLTHRDVVKHGYGRLDRIILTKLIPSMIIGSVTIPYQICGFSNSQMSGNCTGLNAIGDAYRTVGFGEADVMIAGSAEHDFDAVVIEALSKGNYGLNLEVDKSPETASRPYDADRKGWVYSLGAGCLILEELSHALRRGANIYAEVVGYSMLSEAGTETASEGQGVFRSMKKAAKGQKIDAVFGDSPGYGDWDIGEARAIEELCGSETIVNIKGSLGHMNSASSSVNAAIATYSLSKGIVPPCRNLDNPVNKNVQFARDPIEKQLNTIAVNSVNYDGTCFGTILIKRYTS